MRNLIVGTVAAGALLALPMLATAQQRQQACVASLPAELSGWCAPEPMKAAADASGLGKATVPVGRSVDAALQPNADIRFAVQPGKPPGPASYGGLFAFTVEQPGTYRVALGSGAWVDVARDGKVAESTAHSHGPDGSGIHKLVDFQLVPGRYTLQIAANGEPTVTLMVSRLP